MAVRITHLTRRALAALLLPLSMVPFVLVIPRIVAHERTFTRDYLERGALPFPRDAAPGAAELARWAPLPASANAVPVLAYHGIDPRDDIYSVSQGTFAHQMAMLAHAGFHTISPAQYVRFLAGDRRGLPSRPILITFDDGRLDSYRGADAVLARFGFRATIFVITGAVRSGNQFYLRWDELRRMQRSGRWDIQEHAADGHRYITYDKAGDLGPYFANRLYENGHLESMAGFLHRVVGDLLAARRILGREIPGFQPLTFAVPYGDYGQNQSNDPRIAPFMRDILSTQFQAVFTQNRPAYTTPRTPRSDLQRLELHTHTTADQLYAWLARHAPRPSGRARERR